MSPHRVAAVVAPALVWAAGAAVFFRAQWTSGFRWITGDDGDGRLAVYLLEHWYRVFGGDAAWRSPAFFYPVKGVLGWSDGFVLYEVFYAPLRLVGADPFLAAQVSVVLLSLVGFASFYALVRMLFDPPRVVALLGALVFTFSNALWLHAIWYQLLGIWLMPLVVLLAVLAFRRRSLLLGGACGVLAGAAFYTSYYVSWFTALAAVVTLLLWLLAGRREAVAAVAGALRSRGPVLAVAAAGFAAALVPFLLTYLPARKTITPRSYSDVLAFAPHPRDLLNVGPANVFWSRAVHAVLPSVNFASLEQAYAVTPLLTVLAIVGAVVALRVTRRRMPAVLAATAVVLAILPVETRFGSLWAVVWRLPGGDAIRAADRVGLVCGAVATLAVVAAGGELYRASRSSVLRAAIVLLLALAVVEQLNTNRTWAIDRPSELALLRSVHAPPAACRAFYVVDGGERKAPWFAYQTEAMVVSQRVSLPTINGYTGFFPDGWRLFDPSAPDYRAAVAAWVRANGLDAGMCRLDVATMTWRR